MLEKGDLLVIEDDNHVLWDFKVESVNQYNRTATGCIITDGKPNGDRITVCDYQIHFVNERVK